MTERITELLSEAVSGLEPEDRDPLARVVRRGRAARRRTAMAGALAIVLLGGALVAGRQMLPAEQLPTADGRGGTGQTTPHVAGGTGQTTPHVAGGTVVAGAMTLPIPDGWRVVTADVAEPCGNLPRTILLIVSDQRGCQNAPVEVSKAASLNPGGTYVSLPEKTGTLGGLMTSPVSITLPGGEPAWLREDPDSEEMRPGRYPEFNYFNEMLLPWSGVLVVLRTDGPSDQKIIDSIRSDPWKAGVLALPERAVSVELTTPDASGRVRSAGHRKSTDPSIVASVLRVLRRQTNVVADADACAGPAQHSARLTLVTSETSTVVIALGKTCQEAVYSAGGRVQLSNAAVAELTALLGIGDL